MSLPAIEVSGLSKHYVIQHESRHDNLRDTLHHTARKLWRRYRWGTGFETEEFWALRDVSFSVQPGEVVGIIGRNGAGKSTLLKILSRITEPTAGTIRLRGRVASLLEVGTGFHPDLTGRENIFLNGAILGMSRAEIARKFDEIVAFAEIERFLDTPVKRYSSGMYVRLAFAVAAHLEPEILIVDEVLAVGDAQFQKKCLGKMQNVAREGGRTVLFVSHNTAALRRLCNRGVVLQAGKSVHEGGINAVLAFYESQMGTTGVQPATFERRARSDLPTITHANVSGASAYPGAFHAGDPLRIEIAVNAPTPCSGATLGFTISDRGGAAVMTSHHDDVDGQVLNLESGIQRFSIDLNPNLLLPGGYTVSVGLMDRAWSVLALETDCLSFEIVPTEHQTKSHVVNRPGRVFVPYRWRTL